MATPTPRPPSSLSRFPRERVQGNPPRVLGSRDELEDLPSSPTNAPRRFDADAPFGVVARDLHALVEPRIDGEASATLRALGGFPGLADALKVDPRFGLDPDDAADLAARVSRFGANTIPSRPTRTFLDMLADALEDDTLRVLLAAGALSLALEFALETGVDARPEVAGSNLGWVEGAAILGAVAVVAIVTAVNEHQKQTQFERLNAAAEADASAIALRGGRSRTIPVADVVVGDVIRLEAGDVVPADAIVFASTSASVCVDESHLTGESDDVRKDPRTFPPLLSGSRVLQGECDALVACVGSESQMGIITTLVRRIEARGVEGADQGADRGADQGVRLSSDAARRASARGAAVAERTPLQIRLEALAADIGRVGLFAGATCALLMSASFTQRVVFGGGLFVEGASAASWDWSYLREYLRFIVVGATVVVVAVPEGLPLAVTLALAFSVRRMLEDNNLVRYLGACETAGSATCICTDKTGTLTQNRMTVDRVWAAGRGFGPFPPACVDDVACLPAFMRRSSSDGFPGDARTALLEPRSEPIPDPIPDDPECSFGMLLAASADPDATRDVWDPSLGLGDAVVVGEGTVCALDAPDPELWRVLAEAVCVNSTARFAVTGLDPTTGHQTVERSGSRTELALLQFATGLRGDRACAESDRARCRVVRTLPFTPDRRRMCSFARTTPSESDAGGYRMYVKGSVEDVLPLCVVRLASDGVAHEPLDTSLVREVARRWSEEGIHVMLVAFRDFEPDFDPRASPDESLDVDACERGLVLVAAVGMEVPLRPDVPDAVRACSEAGVRPIVVTGDSLPTAIAVARKCGALDRDDEARLNDAATTGDAFLASVRDPSTGAIDRDAFDERWPKLRVLARASPTHKFDLVTAIQRSRARGRREVVAVTGDGTNDAAALKAADVGFAMGETGMDVAKDASDILLLDDTFSSAVAAVRWGRNVFESIQKFLAFQLTVNVSAVTVAVASALVVGESPLSAVQMLWVNLLMDSLGGLALATDAPTDELLRKPPVDVDASIVTRRMRAHIASQAAYQLTVVFALLASGRRRLVFNAFVWMQLVNQINCRKVNERFDVFEGAWRNPTFLGIFASEVGLQVLIVQRGGVVFDTEPLDANQWAACVALGLVALPLRAVVNAWLNASERDDDARNAPATRRGERT